MRFWYRINHLFEDRYFPFAVSLRREEFIALCMDCEKHQSCPARVVPWDELIFLLGSKSPAPPAWGHRCYGSSQRAKAGRGREESGYIYRASYRPGPWSVLRESQLWERQPQIFYYKCKDWDMYRGAMGGLGIRSPSARHVASPTFLKRFILDLVFSFVYLFSHWVNQYLLRAGSFFRA